MLKIKVHRPYSISSFLPRRTVVIDRQDGPQQASICATAALPLFRLLSLSSTV